MEAGLGKSFGWTGRRPRSRWASALKGEIHMGEYEKPEITDLGSLASLTEAVAFTGVEDGGSKLLIHHSAPAAP